MGSGCNRLEMLQLQQKVRKKMKGRKIRIRQGIKGWLLALAMVLSLCSGWKQDVCAQQSQSSSSNLMQDVDTDKKGSIEILFDTMRDEPVANAEFTLYQVAAMVDRGGYTVLELTGGFDGCGVQLKNLTAQQSKEASAALLEMYFAATRCTSLFKRQIRYNETPELQIPFRLRQEKRF